MGLVVHFVVWLCRVLYELPKNVLSVLFELWACFVRLFGLGTLVFGFEECVVLMVGWVV